MDYQPGEWAPAVQIRFGLEPSCIAARITDMLNPEARHLKTESAQPPERGNSDPSSPGLVEISRPLERNRWVPVREEFWQNGVS